MAEEERLFHYVAIEPTGRRVRGSVAASSDGGAFERLKHDGLSPVRIRLARSAPATGRPVRGLSDREAAEFLSDLSALLGAGTDMRAALDVLGARTDRPTVRALARTLTSQIGGGAALDDAFGGLLGKNGALVAALISSGDMVAGMQRAADMLQSRIRLKDQLVSVLSYPAFVFASTIFAVLVILLFVVPSLAPLVAEGGHAPTTLAVLIGTSNLLRTNLLPLAILAAIIGVSLLLTGKLGLLSRPFERVLLDGPFKRTVGGLVFGAFAIALGNMLSAGAPMSEALRLATKSVQSRTARERLDAVAQAVRQGQQLSSALDCVKPFPDTIVRLAAVGEISGALGPMVARAGKIEEDAAIRRLEAAGRVLGPALIVALGGLIGLMMAGLLTGVSQLGQSAIQ